MCNACAYGITCVLLTCSAPLLRVEVVNRRGTFSGGVSICRVPKVTDCTVLLYSVTNLSLK